MPAAVQASKAGMLALGEAMLPEHILHSKSMTHLATLAAQAVPSEPVAIGSEFFTRLTVPLRAVWQHSTAILESAPCTQEVRLSAYHCSSAPVHALHTRPHIPGE